MSKRVAIELSREERDAMRELRRKGKISARKLTRAQILLLADEERSEKEIAALLGTSGNTIWRTKRRYKEEGLGRR